MAILVERDISGTGIETFTATRVNWILFATLTIGYEAKPASARDSDYVLRLGWLALGSLLTIPDVITAEFWRAPEWINFLNTEVSSIPQVDYLANDFGTWADRIRWSLSGGCEAHIVVSGV